MRRPEIVPFSEEHLDEAAALLAARHARHRGQEPLLPEAFEEPARARVELEALWSREGSSGAAALREGKLADYLVGAPRDEERWGPNIWVEFAGHAVEQAENARDLYADAAERWVEQGRKRHYALIPAHDRELIEAWFRLGFGQQQAHAVQETGPRDVQVPAEFEIRPPSSGDVDALIEVDLALPTHQRRAPVFSELALPSEDEVRAEWADTLAGTDEQIFIGYRGDRPVACWALAPAERSSHHMGLGRPERASYLAFAATVPDTRGSGIGVALTEASLAWAADQGYPSMITDWRVTNLLASRFWPRRGFRETFFRLYRSIP